MTSGAACFVNMLNVVFLLLLIFFILFKRNSVLSYHHEMELKCFFKSPNTPDYPLEEKSGHYPYVTQTLSLAQA